MIDKTKSPIENFFNIERAIIAFIMMFISAPCAVVGFYSSHIATVFALVFAKGYAANSTSSIYNDDSSITKFFNIVYDNSFAIWHARLRNLVAMNTADNDYLCTILNMQVDATNDFFKAFTYNGIVMLAVFGVSFIIGYLRHEIRKRDKGK